MMQITQNRIAGIRVLATGVLLALVAAGMVFAAKPAHAETTFTVTNTNDSGQGSLRQAIMDANNTPGADAVEFDIPVPGVATIAPASQLPIVTGPLTINGYSQPGARPNTRAVGSDAVMKIMLSGAKTVGADGLVIRASGSIVKGLVVNRWQGTGVTIRGSGATGNRISGNFIGTGATGAQDLGNANSGVIILGSSGNTVGGTTAGARNVISGNEGTGVLIDGNAATGNRVLFNSIFANDLLGIDLAGTPGPTANDPGDTDTGPNNLQNKPVLSSVRKGSTSTRISGTLDSTPNIAYRVQFFANAEGADEGKRLLGSTTFTTDLAGKASFVFTTKKEIKPGQSITATATGAFGTSEFSAPKQVVAS